MAITKCRIWVSPVNRFTVAAMALRQFGRTPAAIDAGLDGDDDEREQKHRENM
jgi:hypothetical protein